MLGWGTYSGQFTYSITEVFYYITVVLIFVFYLLLVFTFYIFTSQGDRTYRRVRYNDPAVDNLLEIVSNELYGYKKGNWPPRMVFIATIVTVFIFTVPSR